MVLIDLLQGKPVQHKTFTYVLGAIISLLFISYDVIDGINGYFSLGSLIEDLTFVVAVMFIGICIAKDNKNGVLGGVTMLMGYIALEYAQYIGYYADYIKYDIDELNVLYTVVDSFECLIALAFFVGTIAFMLGKFIGYKKVTMIKTCTTCFLLSSILLIASNVIYMVLDGEYLVEYINYYLYSLGFLLIPIYLLVSASFASSINKKVIEDAE